VSLFMALGFPTANKWTPAKLEEKARKLPRVVEAAGDLGDLLSNNQDVLLTDILNALEEKRPVSVVKPEEEEKEDDTEDLPEEADGDDENGDEEPADEGSIETDAEAPKKGSKTMKKEIKKTKVKPEKAPKKAKTEKAPKKETKADKETKPKTEKAPKKGKAKPVSTMVRATAVGQWIKKTKKKFTLQEAAEGGNEVYGENGGNPILRDAITVTRYIIPGLVAVGFLTDNDDGTYKQAG
jgi:hypothetical protein